MLIYLLANKHIHEFLDVQMDDIFSHNDLTRAHVFGVFAFVARSVFSSIVVFEQMEVLFLGASWF